MIAALPRIAVIGTGGTISSLGASSLDVLDYPDFGQKLSCEALLERFPEVRLVADPLPRTFRQVGSTEIGPNDWIELRALIHRVARDDPGIAGFVIPHGTATIEETAFFLNLTLATAQPVVLVGAQRPASALGTDAGMNLVSALRVAGSEAARGKGVLVVLNDEIHAARDVVKTSTYRLHTFRSVDFGCSAMSTVTAYIFSVRRCAPICRIRPMPPGISVRCRESTSSIRMPGPMVRWSMLRSPPVRAALFLQVLRREVRHPSSAPPSSVPLDPGSLSYNAAAPAAASPRAAACAKPASSPVRISRRKKPASC